MRIQDTVCPCSIGQLTMAVMGAGLLFLSAQIELSIGPVPFTLQTAALAVIGLTFSPAAAAGSVILYVGSGALGAPVFAGFSSGIRIITGPTAGYLLAFLPAAWGMATLMERIQNPSLITKGLVTILGSGIVFLGGVSWLSHFVGGVGPAINMGLVPFIVPGMAKAILTALGVHALKQDRS